MSDIRWCGYSDALAVGRILAARFPGRAARARATVRVILVPHLITATKNASIGIRPRSSGGRLICALLGSVWVDRAKAGLVVVPLPLRVTSRHWQVVDFANSLSARAPLATYALARAVLGLADRHRVTLHAEVDEADQRLLDLYRRHGFVNNPGRKRRRTLLATIDLVRPPVGPRPHRHVLRTGRTTLRYFEETFGIDIAQTGARAVLDIGAGDSLLVSELATRGVQAVAIDSDYLRRPPTRGEGDSVAGDASRLPFGALIFDRVIAVFVVQHLPDKSSALREASRVCADDGAIHLHPIWSHAAARRVSRLPGAEVRPGHLIRPRVRPSVTLDATQTREWPQASWDLLAAALSPPAVIRSLGAVGAALWMRVAGTNDPAYTQRYRR